MIMPLLNGVHILKSVTMQFKGLTISLLSKLLHVFVVILFVSNVVKNLIGPLIVKCLKHGKQKIILMLKMLHGSWLIQNLAQILSVANLLRRIKAAITWTVNNVTFTFVGNVWNLGKDTITILIVNLNKK